MSKTPANASPPFQFRLDLSTGVPVYRQLIDQVMGGVAAGRLAAGAQLPTVRQVAVELAINPNTVVRAYREMEIRGALETQQGTGTFVSKKQIQTDEVERQQRLDRLAAECAARAGREGFTLQELLERIHDLQNETDKKR